MQRWICKVLYPYPTYQSLLQATSLGCPVSPHLEEEEGDIQGVIQVIQEVHQCQLELLHDKFTLAFQVTLQVRKIHYLANLGLVCALNDLVKKVKIEFTIKSEFLFFCFFRNLHLSCCCSSRGHSSEIIKFLFLCSSTEVDEAQRLTILKSCLNTTEVVFVDLQKGTSSTLKWSSQQKFKYFLWKRFTC